MINQHIDPRSSYLDGFVYVSSADEDEACYKILELEKDGLTLKDYTKASITRKLHRILFGRECPGSLEEESYRVASLLRCTTNLGLESPLSTERGDGSGDIRQAMKWGSYATLFKRNKNAETLLSVANHCNDMQDFMNRAGHLINHNPHHAYGFFRLAERIPVS